MKQDNLVNGKHFVTLRELYDDQNEATKTQIRVVIQSLGYANGSIHRKINEEKTDQDVLDALYRQFGIVRHPGKGIFFEPIVTKNETLYGLM